MFGHNRVIVMTTGRASLSDSCQEVVAQANMRPQTSRAALRLALLHSAPVSLAETGLLSIWTGS